MGGLFSSSSPKAHVETQTEEVKKAGYGTEGVEGLLKSYSSADIQQMIQLFKEKKTCVDRSSIRGVTKAKDHYDAISRHHSRPVANTDFLHRKNHPKGYLTRITSDHIAQQDEELTVYKGSMVKVLRSHRDGRYEVYSGRDFGLVPGKVLAYIQYTPDDQM